MARTNTSMSIDSELHKAAKKEATDRGIALQTLIDEAIRKELGRPIEKGGLNDSRLRRTLEGMRGLYASEEKDAQALFRLFEQGLKQLGLLSPSGHGRKVGSEL